MARDFDLKALLALLTYLGGTGAKAVYDVRRSNRKERREEAESAAEIEARGAQADSDRALAESRRVNEIAPSFIDSMPQLPVPGTTRTDDGITIPGVKVATPAAAQALGGPDKAFDLVSAARQKRTADRQFDKERFEEQETFRTDERVRGHEAELDVNFESTFGVKRDTPAGQEIMADARFRNHYEALNAQRQYQDYAKRWQYYDHLMSQNPGLSDADRAEAERLGFEALRQRANTIIRHGKATGSVVTMADAIDIAYKELSGNSEARAAFYALPANRLMRQVLEMNGLKADDPKTPAAAPSGDTIPLPGSGGGGFSSSATPGGSILSRLPGLVGQPLSSDDARRRMNPAALVPRTPLPPLHTPGPLSQMQDSIVGEAWNIGQTPFDDPNAELRRLLQNNR